MSSISAKAMGGRTVAAPEVRDEIGKEFKGTHIVSVSIPEGVRRIGDSAFEGCSELRSITFPSTLEHIGKDAFRGCSELRIPALPKSLRRIEPGAFYGCISIEGFETESATGPIISYKGSLYTKAWGLIAYPGGCREKSFETAEATTSVADLAFSGNPYLRFVRLGKNVSRITGKAFLGCRILSEISVDSDNKNYSYSSISLMNAKATELIFVTPEPRRIGLHLQGISSLGAYCLAECDSMDMLCLHDRLEYVHPDAFGEGCRPKKLYVDDDFDCEVPFEFLGSDKEPPEDMLISGKIYRRGKDGKYRHNGFIEQ